ncbi:hypothetical protein F2Q70_00025439 [Brassica cretica]|uniref:Uncharacterized protein n=1 Tax=Brassica cretica TaxID=69181 RepID=A0A8S9LFQ1_BRACR|nr:hypothetical protein F2Q70_00025439 [Brassica cretica]
MNDATSVNVKKSTLINYGGHNIRETTSTSFSVARQSAESETDAGNFSVSYVSAFSVARQSAKSETGEREAKVPHRGATQRLSDIYMHSCYHGLTSFREEEAPHARATAAVRSARLDVGLGGGPPVQ